MKSIEAKIPVWSVIVTIISIVLVIVILTIFATKNKKVIYYKSKVDSIQASTSIIIRQQEDSIDYLKAVIKNRESRLQISKDNIKSLTDKLADIPKKVTQYTPNELYDKIQQYISQRTDSNKYDFSGNQLEDIYKEHLYIDEQQNLISEYEFYVVDLMDDVKIRDKEISEYDKLSKLKDKMLEESNKICDELEVNLLKQEKRKKIWRMLTPIGTGVGIVVGLLL